MQTIEQNKDWYLKNFEVFEKSLNGESSSQFHSIRKAAISRFAELGFPTTRNEEWKYTDVSPLAGLPFKPVLGYRSNGLTMRDIERFSYEHLRWNRLVCINGHFSQELSAISSMHASVKMGSLSAAMKNDPALLERHLARYAPFEENAFTALSTAFLQDGAFIYIPDGIILENPIYIICISTGNGDAFITHPRNLIVIGNNSQAAVLESFVGVVNNTYLTNAVTEIALGENAVLEHDTLQQEDDRAFHVGTIHVRQHRNSNFVSNSISFGGTLVRNNITTILDGEGAEATLNGLYLGTGVQHIDNHTTIDHTKPHCSSHELYKGILDGKSHGVFNGKIIVRKDAQKTDAKQTNKNLILSDNAAVDTKPQLEIFANDVRCTHGATIGQLDDDAIFYLRSRGIALNKARDMLISAFASEVINRIRVESLRAKLQNVVHELLEQAHAARGQKGGDHGRSS